MNGTHKFVYLDNNATTQVAPQCVEAMCASLQDSYGNPSSKHGSGAVAKRWLGDARAQVASLLHATPPEIVFTSCGTESNHMAIQGALALSPRKRHVVTSTVEHPSTLLLLKHLETQGVRVTYVPVDKQGRLEMACLERAVDSDTALVTLMWANNETGVLFPVEQVAAIARRNGALFHTDAVQAAGKIPLDLARVPADLLSLSGHKLHGPKGIGALFVRKGIKLPPLFFGHQERGRRGGTENVPAIVGLGVACRLAQEGMDDELTRVKALRDKLEAAILAQIPFARVNGAGTERVPNTTNICFAGVNGEMLLDRLDKNGIFASSGAACTAGGSAPSHVLTAMGLEQEAAMDSVRFSLSRYTTDSMIDQALEVLQAVVQDKHAEAA
ncbi:cysteine desulfurase [Sulfuricella sp. T08]|uniref:cysteine desulfurase family protein n=1 Tax=Sulfuricella sp. T08 TaxID=1632857 RepID=UPI0006179B4A|nr:aminotransferase class V-fold PLP-dependent enzyme [Sulfuricella sp. T08]GAO37796.1 cysteine desulfurase [Sulfuricella sp. T08]